MTIRSVSTNVIGRDLNLTVKGLLTTEVRTIPGVLLTLLLANITSYNATISTNVVNVERPRHPSKKCSSMDVILPRG